MKHLKPVRKTITKNNRAIFMETHEVSIVDQNIYRTNGEELIIVKNIDFCEIILDSERNNNIIIKTLTNCIIKPDRNKIDEDWDEIELKRGSCVQFHFANETWYILSSDGIKMD
jgi:hypothetical protein